MRETHRNLLFDPEALSPEEHVLILKEIALDRDIREKIEDAIRRKREYRIQEKKKVLELIKESQNK